MTDITDREDSPDMFMDDRLNLRALKNKRYLDKTLELEFYQNIDKRELLELLLKSTILLHEGAEHIAQQRSSLVRFQMDEIQRHLK